MLVGWLDRSFSYSGSQLVSQLLLDEAKKFKEKEILQIQDGYKLHRLVMGKEARDRRDRHGDATATKIQQKAECKRLQLQTGKQTAIAVIYGNIT